jgi:hypothetical protein
MIFYIFRVMVLIPYLKQNYYEAIAIPPEARQIIYRTIFFRPGELTWNLER